MDNLDDSENNAKVSDSAYSNSCSNSQSRRSHSSKSTHSGSNSSGSSGYGGKPSTFSDTSGQPPEKRSKDKEAKKKKQGQLEKTSEVEKEVEERASELAPIAEHIEVSNNVEYEAPQLQTQTDKVPEDLENAIVERSNIDEVIPCNSPLFTSETCNIDRPSSSCGDGFSCVISMDDGVVMFATSSLTETLGFPKDMWIGRSFIDFIHLRDRNTFASHITSGLAVPKNVNGMNEEAPALQNSVCTMVCRMRKYRSLSSGFSVKDRNVTFMPFLLRLSFRNVSDDEGKVTYLVIQATPFYSAFKIPNEIVVKPVPFVIRHGANGNMEYMDPESVPYLGYIPQDMDGKDALQLYHHEDLPYLCQVYETIVREGGVPRSKSYRMITQNNDSIRVETEWSSFTNPWSRKLEFVVGKHHVVEGPANPDIFQMPETEKLQKGNEEERKKKTLLRENILRIMNEALTTPAEIAKQQMTKRCQDLATFMESLMETETPKPEEELHLEIQDQDNSYYERDSVMLGGISPHHDYNDSKSSTETPLSYNQLNYNETLQRYFDSHQPHSYNDYNTVTGENVLSIKDAKSGLENCMSSVTGISGGPEEMSSCDSTKSLITGNSPSVGPTALTAPLRLTETLIIKHNAEMEKELIKMHAKSRSSSKGERNKEVSETRKKKKEHLARCNAMYQPTLVANISNEMELMKKPRDVGSTKKKQDKAEISASSQQAHQSCTAAFNSAENTKMQSHGVKRASKYVDSDSEKHKHHCSSSRQSRKKQNRPPTPDPNNVASSVAATNWLGNSMNGMNTILLGVGFPQQVPIMSPMGGMPGMIPMYYSAASAGSGIPGSPCVTTPSNNNAQFQQPMPCMMYGQAVYGAPFLYSPVDTPYALHNMTNARVPSTSNSMIYPLRLANSNFEEACKQSLPKPRSQIDSCWRQITKQPKQPSVFKSDQNSTSNFSSNETFNRDGGCSENTGGEANMELCSTGTMSTPHSLCLMSTDAGRDSILSRNCKKSDENLDRIDDSSYSSFYSSFFKTESGSAEESSDANKSNPFRDAKATAISHTHYNPPKSKSIARRKLEPPWTEKVCVTSELIYKYQVLTKESQEVLKSDKTKIYKAEQPGMVEEQLGQLYMDMQLEGVAARLSLEEGITSSSSSGEETSEKTGKLKRKRNYSKLVMIFEEDAPLPPPDDCDYLQPPSTI